MSAPLTRRRALRQIASAFALAAPLSRASAAPEASTSSGEGGVPAAVPAKPASRAAQPPLRLAFIGIGGRGRTALASLAGQSFVAFADVDDARAAAAYREFPSVPHYRDYRRLLDRHAREIDGVVISAPDHHHACMALAALQLGKHVYLEKPLAPTIAECRLIAQAAAAAGPGVRTQFGTHGHSMEALRVLREWIDAGAVGRIQTVHLWTERLPVSQAVWRTEPPEPKPIPESLDWDLWLGPRAARPFSPDYHPSRWRNWWDFGAGALGDIAVHMFDTIEFALELGLPERAETLVVQERSPLTAPPWGQVRWVFPRPGAACRPGLEVFFTHGTREGRFLKPASVPHLPGALVQETLSGIALAGTEGTLFIPDMRASVRPQIFPEAREAAFLAARPAPTLPRPKGHHYQDWIDAIRAGRPAGAPIGYGARVTECVLQAALAQRTGAVISREGNSLLADGKRLAPEKLGPGPARSGWGV